MKPSRHHAELFGSPWRGLFGTRIDSDRHYGRHSHASFGIGLIERGAQCSASGRGRVEAHAGHVITTNPGEVHDGHPIGGHPRRWRMIYAEPDVFAELAGTGGVVDASRLELSRPVVTAAHSADAVRMFFAALDVWLASPDHRGAGPESLACEESFVTACAGLLGHPAPPITRPDVPIEIRRARERIADDLCQAPSLADLARDSGMSKYQLLRRFVAAYGLPPHRWLVQCRVEHARRLIGSGERIVDAACASGFADQSHLTRHFTQQLGFTPGAWRDASLQ